MGCKSFAVGFLNQKYRGNNVRTMRWIMLRRGDCNKHTNNWRCAPASTRGRGKLRASTRVRVRFTIASRAVAIWAEVAVDFRIIASEPCSHQVLSSLVVPVSEGFLCSRGIGGFCDDDSVMLLFSVGAMRWHVQSRSWLVLMHKSIQTASSARTGGKQRGTTQVNRPVGFRVLQTTQEPGYVTRDISEHFTITLTITDVRVLTSWY